MRKNIMAKINPLSAFLRMSGRLDRKSNLVLCTYGQTGTVYTRRSPEPRTDWTEAQRLSRERFAKKMQQINRWYDTNAPGRNPAFPQGTMAYFQLQMAFQKQKKVKTMMAFLWQNIREDGTSEFDGEEELEKEVKGSDKEVTEK